MTNINWRNQPRTRLAQGSRTTSNITPASSNHHSRTSALSNQGYLANRNRPMTHYRNSSEVTHPSTSTSSNSQVSGGCECSICYSYLIAIGSSFLIVLGIYLALTKFNPSYLYISLVGLLSVAISACIYCAGNILKSKMARRKQRLDSSNYVPNGGHTTNIHQNTQQQAAQITRGSHILSNGNIVRPQSESLNVHNNINSNSNEFEPATQRYSSDLPDSSSQVASSHVREHNANRVVIDSQSDQRCNSSCNDNRPKLPTTACQQPPQSQVDTITHSLGTTSQDASVASAQASSNSRAKLEPHRITISHNETGESKTNQALIGNHHRIQPVEIIDDGCDNEKTTSTDLENLTRIEREAVLAVPEEPAQQQAVAQSIVMIEMNHSPGSSQRENTTQQSQLNIGGLIATDSNSTPARKTTAEAMSPRRAANIRRTLVMGISGEEEVIEIDEEDLDNMSVLPPPYESITVVESMPTNKTSA